MPLDLIFYEDKQQLNSILEKAKELGTDKLIIAKSFTEKELSELRSVFDQHSHRVFFCHIVNENNKKSISSIKAKADFIGVIGDSVEMNKFAVSRKDIDFLIQPIDDKKPAFDIGTARLASERKISVVLLFRDYLNSFGFKQMQLFKNSRFLVKLLKRFKVDCLIFSGAKKSSELRKQSDLSAVLEIFGFSRDQAERFTTTFPESLIKVKL